MRLSRQRSGQVDGATDVTQVKVEWAGQAQDVGRLRVLELRREDLVVVGLEAALPLGADAAEGQVAGTRVHGGGELGVAGGVERVVLEVHHDAAAGLRAEAAGIDLLILGGSENLKFDALVLAACAPATTVAPAATTAPTFTTWAPMPTITGRPRRCALAMAFATSRNVLTARISGSESRNRANERPLVQTLAKLETCTLLCRR